jgi:hypothetical protein
MVLRNFTGQADLHPSRISRTNGAPTAGSTLHFDPVYDGISASLQHADEHRLFFSHAETPQLNTLHCHCREFHGVNTAIRVKP